MLQSFFTRQTTKWFPWLFMHTTLQINCNEGHSAAECICDFKTFVSEDSVIQDSSEKSILNLYWVG